MNKIKTLVLSLCCLASSLTGVTAQGAFDAITIMDSGGAAYITHKGGEGGFGWSFIPSTDIQVTEVGAANVGLTSDVTLWTSDFQSLARYTIAAPWEPTGVTYQSISPVILIAGNRYYISALPQSNGRNYFIPEYTSDWSFTLAPQIKAFVNYGISANGVWQPSIVYFPHEYDELYLGPTFRFVSVPEPRIAALIFIGVTMLLRNCRKRH